MMSHDNLTWTAAVCTSLYDIGPVKGDKKGLILMGVATSDEYQYIFTE